MHAEYKEEKARFFEVWWQVSIILVLGRQQQKDWEFDDSMRYAANSRQACAMVSRKTQKLKIKTRSK